MPQIKHIDSGTIIDVAQPPEFRAGIWECGDQRFTDPDGDQYEPVEEVVATVLPKVSPVEFLLLFTIEERVAIKNARANNLVIADFYSIVEDPRLTYVDLGLQSTRGALDYLVGLELLTEARRDEILLGVVM